MAGQYPWNASAHSHCPPQGFECCLFWFHRFRDFHVQKIEGCYRVVGTCHLDRNNAILGINIDDILRCKHLFCPTLLMDKFSFRLLEKHILAASHEWPDNISIYNYQVQANAGKVYFTIIFIITLFHPGLQSTVRVQPHPVHLRQGGDADLSDRTDHFEQ